jgi:hypothetical protein
MLERNPNHLILNFLRLHFSTAQAKSDGRSGLRWTNPLREVADELEPLFACQ